MAKLTCKKCQEDKPRPDFYTRNTGRIHSYTCKDCLIVGMQARYCPAKKRNDNLIRNYGITVDDYNKMLEEQGGRCVICTDDNVPLAVDHNHDTGEVRGLLCRKCNSGLGMFKDNDLLLIAAAGYLLG